jgi:predicted P-loop ATPase
MVHTPSGGVHLYLAHREGQRNLEGCPVKGVDVRGDDGLCWAWFLNGYATENFDIPPVDWPDLPDIPLKESIRKEQAKPKVNAAPPAADLGPLPEHLRNRVKPEHLKDAGYAQFDRVPPPCTQDNVAWVRELLAAIPTTITERDIWLNIGRALHWLNWDETGRELWVEFSRRFTEFFDEAGLDTQWNSFHTEGREKPITLGTLVQIAKEHGWQPRPEPQAARPQAGEPWQKYAMRNHGQIIPNVTNAILALEHCFPIRFTYDQFACCIKIDRDQVLKDADVIEMQVWLQQQGIRRIGKDPVFDAITARAQLNSYHPLREEILSVKWDGIKRVEKFSTTHLGCPDNAYNNGIGSMFLISMVARVFNPGCQCDYMPILESGQGTLKSSALRALAGDKYFSDQLPDLHHKDSSQHLRDKWVIEIAEMHTFDRATINQLKAYITRRVERYRPPYGRLEVVEPRQCVFAGTMNPIGGAGYWRDPTGARRIWPIRVGVVKPIDLEAIERDRGQLFAEAYQRFTEGWPWWPTPDWERQYILPEQEARYEDDIWEEKIGEWLDITKRCKKCTACLQNQKVKVVGLPRPTCENPQVRMRTTVGEVAKEALEIGAYETAGPAAKLSRADQNRITAALAHLKWERGGRTANARYWVRKANDAP